MSFYGAGPNFNSGAIRLDNATSSTVTLDSVTVDMQRPGPVFSLWTNIAIPANGSAILTQTSAYNFDTSGFPIVPCGGTTATGDTRIPKITVTQGGSPTSFLDTSHVLDTGGFDLSCRGNRSLAWRPIGTTGIEAPSAGITASPDGSITQTGVAVALAAQVVDASGQPLANAPVTFLIKSGPNSGKTSQGATDAQGTVAFSYASLTAGSDSIQASLTNLTNTNLNSTPISANWTSSGPCPTPSASFPGSTSVVYVGQTAAHVGDSFQAGALLIDAGGNGISGQTISFKFLSFTNSATTDSTGVARVNFTATSAVATSVSASFVGTTNYSASSTSSSITIAQENTEIIYTGPTLLSTGSPQQITAKLIDLHHNAPLANKTLTFQVGTLQVTAVTNSSGIATASATLTSSQTTGPGQVQVSFAGDANYQPSFTSVPVTIALSGSFVIWGGNSGGLHLGQDVNFWGAQWASQVTGGNFTANPSFKGYAQNVTAWQLCEVLAGSGQQTLDDKCWSAGPGNSSSPPATVPQYIEVIVSNAISKQGSEIYGNIVSLAILKVDPTPVYGHNPGHPGNGTIVAVMQDGGHVFPTLVTLAATQNQAVAVLPGQTIGVNTQVTNSGQTTASNVVIAESFDGIQPATGSQSDASLPTGGQFSASFPETVPTYPMRQTNESSTAYETRLAGVDGRRFTSTGTVTYTDLVGQPYLPLNLTS